MTEDTTDSSLWLSWSFLGCAAVVVLFMVLAVILIWKFEGPRRSASLESEDQCRGGVGFVYKDAAWKTCLKGIHPSWLLGFRIVGFIVLVSLITTNLIVDGGGIMYFYTQWTFTLVTFYSVLGISMSVCGICTSCKGSSRNHFVDAERDTYITPMLAETAAIARLAKSMDANGEPVDHETAGVWGYGFQIAFQVCGGAVVITDAVFWFIIYPFLTDEGYKLDYLNACMHSVNAAFILGDTCLNCMRFPLFRIGYFILWTGIYVIFELIIHACAPTILWPYPFLNISFPYAPLWYLGVALLHFPCYGLFALIVRLKILLVIKIISGVLPGFQVMLGANFL